MVAQTKSAKMAKAAAGKKAVKAVKGKKVTKGSKAVKPVKAAKTTQSSKKPTAPYRPMRLGSIGPIRKGSFAMPKKLAAKPKPIIKPADPKTQAPKGLGKYWCPVINMEKRSDRFKTFEKMFKKQCPWLEFEKFRASDGKNDDIPETEVTATWNTANNALYGEYDHARFRHPGVEYKMSPGERGCAHSHYRIWKEAAEKNSPTLVLEDDASVVFERSGEKGAMDGKIFTKLLDKGLKACPDDIDVLYLGWSGYRQGNFKHLEEDEDDDFHGEKCKIIKRAEYVWTTIAYVLWPKGAKKLLDQGAVNQPVDNYMAWECREGRLNSFVLLDEGDNWDILGEDDDFAGGIVAQADFWGDSDIPKSDGGATYDDNLEFCLNPEDRCVKPPEEDEEMEEEEEEEEEEEVGDISDIKIPDAVKA